MTPQKKNDGTPKTPPKASKLTAADKAAKASIRANDAIYRALAGR